jgi:predicted kinase
MSWYVFDLDGTLADNAHRQNLLPDNWDAFFEACDKDTPIWPVLDLMTNLWSDGHRIEIWSGRAAAVRDKTVRWFEDQCGIFLDLSKIVLRMRMESDYRPDEIIKAEWLAESPAKPDIIFDDRQKVVDMWRKSGVVCAQVAPGDYDMKIRPSSSVATGEDHILVLMIGPSGTGKSSWIKHGMEIWEKNDPDDYDPTCVISTDFIRANLTNDYKNQKRNGDVFKAVEALVRTRMSCGLRTIVDATHLDPAWRKKLVSLVPPGMKVMYCVVNASLAVKLAHANGREPDVIISQHHTFNHQLSDILAGDGLPNVIVQADIHNDDGSSIIIDPYENDQ